MQIRHELFSVKKSVRYETVTNSYQSELHAWSCHEVHALYMWKSRELYAWRNYKIYIWMGPKLRLLSHELYMIWISHEYSVDSIGHALYMKRSRTLHV